MKIKGFLWIFMLMALLALCIPVIKGEEADAAAASEEATEASKEEEDKKKQKEEEAAQLREELKTVIDEDKMREILQSELDPIHTELQE